MKKIFALLSLMLALVCLPSCNEDATQNDAPLTAQLMGTWLMNQSSKDFIITDSYIFQSQSRFRYSYSYTDMHEAKMKAWSVSGAWNVKKGVLQLSYDVDTYRAEGYSQSEMNEMKQTMIDNNQMLQDMNKNNRPFGNSIEFKNIDGRTVLLINGVNGYYERVAN